jgi:hypothetical protein
MPTVATSVQINGITCWDEARKVVFGRGFQTNGQRQLRCAWGDALRLSQFLMGGAQVIGGITVFLPMHAFSVDLPYLFPDTIEIDGEGAKSQDAHGDCAYERAVLTMRYTPLGVEENGSQDIDFGKEIISLPGDALKFTNNHPVPFGIPISVPTARIQQSRANMGILPVPLILTVIAAPVDNSGLFGTQADTLLFDGGRALRTFTSAGQTNWTVQYAWVYRPPPYEWGKFCDPLVTAGNPFVKVVRKSDGSDLYLKSSHSALLA